MKLQNVMLAVAIAYLMCAVGYAQTCPGGVEDTITNRYWYDANRTGLANNNPVANWLNWGGSSTIFTQPISGSQPQVVYNQMNGYPAVVFDGTDDHYNVGFVTDINYGNSWLERSYFFAFRTGSNITTEQVIWEEGGSLRGIQFVIANDSLRVAAYNQSADGVGSPWGYLYLKAPVAANTGYIVSFIMKGTDGITGIAGVYLNGRLVGNLGPVGRLYTHPAGTALGCRSSDYLTPGGIVVPPPTLGMFFRGSIAEFIHYNNALTASKRLIIENYLSAKYNIPLLYGDIYRMNLAVNGNFDHDVAGIGRLTATDRNDSAQGTGMIRIQNPAHLDNNEFLIWGHNNLLAQAIEVIDVPPGVQSRFARVWRVSEQDTNGAAVDVGAIDLQFMLSMAAPVNAVHLRLLVDTDNDGMFMDETPIGGAINPSGNLFQFSGVTVISNRRRFTIATIDTLLTPLPIELGDLNTTCEEEGTRVSWTTLSELNNDYFTLERSTDGNQWEQVGMADGCGTCNSVVEYELTDHDAIPGMSYYRLSQTDWDGEMKVCGIVASTCTNTPGNDISVYPNPAKNWITVSGPDNVSQFEIYDTQGHCVLVAGIEKKEEQISVKHLETGIYTFRYLSENRTYFGKLIIAP